MKSVLLIALLISTQTFAGLSFDDDSSVPNYVQEKMMKIFAEECGQVTLRNNQIFAEVHEESVQKKYGVTTYSADYSVTGLGLMSYNITLTRQEGSRTLDIENIECWDR